MKPLNETALIQNDVTASRDMELLDMEGDVSDSYLAELTRRALIAHDIQSRETAIHDWIN